MFCSEIGPGFGLNGQHTPTDNSKEYRPPPPPGEEPSSNDIGDKLSEDEDSGTHEGDAVEALPANVLSRTVRTRTE